MPPHHPITAFQFFCTAPSLKHTRPFSTEQLPRTNFTKAKDKRARTVPGAKKEVRQQPRATRGILLLILTVV
jgi:hypothetical protein